MLDWLVSYDDALARAKATEKFVLLDFYSPT